MSTTNSHSASTPQSAGALPRKLDSLPQSVREAVLVDSLPVPDSTPKVQGYDFNRGVDYEQLMRSFLTTGFQGSHLAEGIDILNEMIRCRNEPLDEIQADAARLQSETPPPKCRIFLGYTSNMVSSGVRDIIRFLVQHKLVDCLVTTAGGIEEDFIKCLAPSFMGSFDYSGADLRKKGLNRIGNLLVPNDNYCKFEDWLMPHLDTFVDEQKTQGKIWSPSSIIDRLGKEINNEESIYYWCHVNKIPVFCPALTDGSLGDMIYFHSYKNPGLIVDIAQDIRKINTLAVKSLKTGMLILGGGMIKHHIYNANLMVRFTFFLF